MLAAVVLASRRRPRTDPFQMSALDHDLYEISSPVATSMLSGGAVHDSHLRMGHLQPYPTTPHGYPSTYSDVEAPTGSTLSGSTSPTTSPPQALSPVRTHASPTAEGAMTERSSHGSVPISEGSMVESEAGELHKVGAERGISGAGEGHRADD